MMKIKKLDKQSIFIIIRGLVMVGVISKFFYDSIIAFVVLLPLIYPYYRLGKIELEKQRKQELEKEFKDMILSVSANLVAGYSVENAFKESYKDVVLLYGTQSVMAKEIYLLIQRLQNNHQLEDILMDMAARSNVEDIMEFANVFYVAKRRGGDIRAVISNTANILGDKMEVRREIRTIMSEKQFEQKIMRYIPFVIIAYVSFTTKGFFDSLYHSLIGVLVMTGCLIAYVVAWGLSEKILDIEI